MRLNNALQFNYVNGSKGWPPERRMKQAARIRAAKIWTKSTGPKTDKGKKICANNAVKHGFFNKGWRALRHALAVYRKFLKLAKALLARAAEQGRTRLSPTPAPRCPCG